MKDQCRCGNPSVMYFEEAWHCPDCIADDIERLRDQKDRFKALWRRARGAAVSNHRQMQELRREVLFRASDIRDMLMTEHSYGLDEHSTPVQNLATLCSYVEEGESC